MFSCTSSERMDMRMRISFIHNIIFQLFIDYIFMLDTRLLIIRLFTDQHMCSIPGYIIDIQSFFLIFPVNCIQLTHVLDHFNMVTILDRTELYNMTWIKIMGGLYRRQIVCQMYGRPYSIHIIYVSGNAGSVMCTNIFFVLNFRMNFNFVFIVLW